MAFTANYSERDYPEITNAFVRIQSYQEYQKNCLLVIVGIWRNKDSFTSGDNPAVIRRYFVPIANIDYSVNVRTGIYNIVSAGGEYSNVVIDTSVDIPPPPIPS